MKVSVVEIPLSERHIILTYGERSERGFQRLKATVNDVLLQVAAIESAAMDAAIAHDRYTNSDLRVIDCNNRLERERAALFEMLAVEGYPE